MYTCFIKIKITLFSNLLNQDLFILSQCVVNDHVIISCIIINWTAADLELLWGGVSNGSPKLEMVVSNLKIGNNILFLKKFSETGRFPQAPPKPP